MLNEQAPRDGLCTTKEAAEYLRLGKTKVCEMIRDGSLPSKLFGRSRRLSWSAVRALAEVRGGAQ